MVIIRKKHKESAEEKEARLQKEQEQSMGIQDQYQARGFELVSWVQDNKTLVSVLIAVLILGGAGFSAYLYYQQRSAEAASSAFLEAVKVIDGIPHEGEENIGKWKDAQANLTKLAEAHKSSGVAVLANIYAGHVALENNDAKQAVVLYERAISQMKKDDVLYPLALIGLGYAQERSGDKKSALSNFERVIEGKNALGKDLAYWEAARLAKDAQDGEKVKKYVADLSKDFPASIYEKNAKKLVEGIQ